MTKSRRVIASSLPMRKHQRSRNLGFTLIELLVVIAIIAILASLLLPALARAKFHGRNAVCRSNLRQIGIALEVYGSTYEVYPPWTAAASPDGMTAWDWTHFIGLMPDQRVSTIISCPVLAPVERHDSYSYNAHGVALPGFRLG